MERHFITGPEGAGLGGAGKTVRRGNAEAVCHILSEWLFFGYGDAVSESQEQAAPVICTQKLMILSIAVTTKNAKTCGRYTVAVRAEKYLSDVSQQAGSRRWWSRCDGGSSNS